MQRGCGFKRFIWTDGAGDRLCMGSGFHYCGHVFEFYKASLFSWKSTHLVGKIDFSWSLTLNSTQPSFGCNCYLDGIILDTPVHSNTFSFPLSAQQVVAHSRFL